MQPTLTLTEAACAYIKKMVAKEQGIGFRLSIKKTGCSGYTYLPAIVKIIDEKDICFTIDEIKIYIDPVWRDLLMGINVDYIEEETAGLKQKKLVFANPNESSRCGCGQSFHIE